MNVIRSALNQHRPSSGSHWDCDLDPIGQRNHQVTAGDWDVHCSRYIDWLAFNHTIIRSQCDRSDHLCWCCFIFCCDCTAGNELLRRWIDRTGVLQRQWRCVFNHIRQAHIRAACAIATGHDGRGGIQFGQGVLPLIQGRDQCIHIRIGRIGNGGFSRSWRIEQIIRQLDLLVFCNLQNAVLVPLQSKLAARCSDDVRIHRDTHANTQWLQVAVSATNPSLPFELGDQCRSICHDISPKYQHH